MGERLTKSVKVPKGGGEKNAPYDFASARQRVTSKLVATTRALDALPADACPNNEAVAVLTMHPRYISKSDFPAHLLSAVGLRSVGSRARTIAPEQWGVNKHPALAVTEDYFVAGSRSAFAKWGAELDRWSARQPGADDLGHVEDVAAVIPRAKLRGVPASQQRTLFEVVLHGNSESVLEAFVEYARSRGSEVLRSRCRAVRGLQFVPVRAHSAEMETLATFSFVRVMRGMPALRPTRPSILRSATQGFAVTLPDQPALNPELRVLICDGGIPDGVDLSKWVRPLEPDGIGDSVAELTSHGLGVTGAFLFGPLAHGTPLMQPLCSVDHLRIVDTRTGVDDEQMLYLDVLDRITKTLDGSSGAYEFVNLSVGPNLAMEDDEITAWTAALDERFGRLKLVATVAAGNNGHLDAPSGLNRVQPPADGVNVVSVGAADSAGEQWKRATYSSVGPGRSPGLVKPDGIAFGGSPTEPFMVLSPDTPLRAIQENGTSYAAPLALRTAVGLRVRLGSSFSHLAIRGLMIHCAERNEHHQNDVGWGRFPHDVNDLVTTPDDEAIVIYQGELPVGEHLRARIPTPKDKLTGKVVIRATLVIAPDVDPNHPSAYTRSGLEVAFRPHSLKHTTTKGKRSMHAASKTFFSSTKMYGASEAERRDDGHKWEPCLRHGQSFLASSIHEPCFDIYYHNREFGTAATDPKPIPYALIVTLQAPNVPDLYSQVVRTYANILVPIRPEVRIPIRTRG